MKVSGTVMQKRIGVATGVAGVAFATPLFEVGWQEYLFANPLFERLKNQ